MAAYNPFRPGSIVRPGMFTGRIKELKKLEQILNQTKHENPNHFLILGERGIGKSSLLLYLDYVAKGELETFDGDSFKFLTATVVLEPSNDYIDIIRKMGAELLRVVAENQRAKERLKSIWNFLKKWEVLGIKHTDIEQTVLPHALLDELIATIEQTISGLGAEFDGILFLIDEADKPPHESGLGEIGKLLTEGLTRRGCEKVSLGLAALPGIVKTLRDSHESSPRVFDMLTLETLSRDDRIEVVRKGLAKAEQINGFKISITSRAENLISEFSEGYPHFIQQFASSAFDRMENNEITEASVAGGAFADNGALHQLGVKYFSELYFEKIGSDEYRSVLGVMSEHLDDWVTKKQIREATTMRNSTLDNAIRALLERKIILPREGKRGEYRLPTKSFAIWIKVFNRPESTTLNT